MHRIAAVAAAIHKKDNVWLFPDDIATSFLTPVKSMDWYTPALGSSTAQPDASRTNGLGSVLRR